MHRFKSYDENKILSEKVAINGVFPLYLGPKLKMGGRFDGYERNSFLFDILSLNVLTIRWFP